MEDMAGVIKPIFKENYVPVVMSVNEKFIPVLSVFLISVIENSDSSHNYDFIIFYKKISQKSRARINKLIKGRHNFSVRFETVMEYFDRKNLFIHEHFSIEVYFRLLIPEKMKAYDKVLYLDADMIVKRDIYDLYEENLQGYILGAVRDIGMLSFANTCEDTKRVLKKMIKMKKIYHYFNSGVLVIDVRKMGAAYSSAELIKIAMSKKWPTVDQDVLNYLFEGETKIINMSWNTMFDYMNRMNLTRRLSGKYYSEYMEARKKPYIIHFAGNPKPWQDPDADFGEYFWEYARKSDYYEQILYDMARHCREH